MSVPFGKQPCFLCKGEGQLWPFENKGGISKNCYACKGSKFIEDFYIKCPHCNGTNKIYDNDDGIGFPEDCKLCNKLGYIDFAPIPCTHCGQYGRIWPFENKGGIPKECEHCKGKGYNKGAKLQRQQFSQQRVFLNQQGGITNQVYYQQVQYNVVNGQYLPHGYYPPQVQYRQQVIYNSPQEYYPQYKNAT